MVRGHDFFGDHVQRFQETLVVREFAFGHSRFLELALAQSTTHTLENAE